MKKNEKPNTRYQREYRRKVKSLKSSDPKAYTKRRNVINRANRVYRRKQRVGKDPVRIVNRISKLAFEFSSYEGRLRQLRELKESTNIDEEYDFYKGESDTDWMSVADTIDLLREWIYYCTEYEFYFENNRMEHVTFILNNKQVCVPFFRDLKTARCAYSVGYEGAILIHDGKVYLRRQYKFDSAKHVGYEVINTYEKKFRGKYMNQGRPRDYENILKTIYGLNLDGVASKVDASKVEPI